ncbi:MAG: FkbM family methyltransferase, partial [Chthoniobacterales bacterium]
MKVALLQKRWTIRRIQNAIIGRYKKLVFRPRIIDREIAGERIRFLIGDLFGAGWYGPQHAPWPELEWIKNHGIRRGDVVIDCGANHGFTSLLFAKWAGNKGVVHAIEPWTHNVEILQENLRLNDITNVLIHQVAAGGRNGTAMLTDHHPNATITEDVNERSISVKMRRLDDEISDEQVDFVKIDVEGFEIEVLKGLQRILADLPRLALEIHVFLYKDKIQQLKELFGLLPMSKYIVEIQPEVDGPIISFDPARHTPQKLAN